jgi:hypothetical protein
VLHIVCVCARVFVALVIQHAMRMRRVVLSSVPALLYKSFLHYLINAAIFGGGGVIEHKMCVFIFSTTFV